MIVHDVHPFFLEIAGVPRTVSMSAGEARDGGSFRKVQPAAGRAKFHHNIKYLGLDQDASRLAWARGGPGIGPDLEKPDTGTFGLPDWVGPNGIFDWAVPQKAVHAFIAEQAREGVTHVLCEQPFTAEPKVPGQKMNRLMNRQLDTIAGAIAFACLEANIHCREVTPSTWRPKFIGIRDARNYSDDEAKRRRFLKEEAMRVCRNREWAFATEHEAEALGILNYGLVVDFSEYEQRWLPLFYTRRHS